MENNKNQELANQAYDLLKNGQLTVETLEKLIPYGKIDIVEFTKAFLDNIQKKHEISTIANRDVLLAMIEHLNKIADNDNVTLEERKQIIEYLKEIGKIIYVIQKDKNDNDYKLQIVDTVSTCVVMIVGILAAPKIFKALSGFITVLKA